MVVRDACPACASQQLKNNGHTRHGKQQHQCKACERQCSSSADNHRISHERRSLIERLLCERISLRRICRAVGVSRTWLLHCMGESASGAPESHDEASPENQSSRAV
jgi:transposase-like protein